jgi:hypothetical protein
MSITKKEPPKKTDVILVLDDSGSMAHIQTRTLQETNRFIAATKKGAAEAKEKTGQTTTFSTILFGSTVTVYEARTPIERVSELASYSPGQSRTHIVGGINKALDLVMQDNDTAFLIVVITDGGENVDLYNYAALASVKERIRLAQGTGRCTLTFQVPRGYTQNILGLFDVPAGNVMEWDQTDQGAEAAGAAREVATSGYFTARSRGMSSMDTFYAKTDLSKVTKTKLKRELTDISSKCRVWTVDKDDQISPFCARKSRTDYVSGAGFYQLYKREVVQPYKKVLIKPKDSDAIYGGDEARELIGIPVGQTVKLSPGNQGNYEVFVQSTSPNRKLPKGTQLVYYPEAKTDRQTWTATK